jgi:hypothetical protein
MSLIMHSRKARRSLCQYGCFAQAFNKQLAGMRQPTAFHFQVRGTPRFACYNQSAFGSSSVSITPPVDPTPRPHTHCCPTNAASDPAAQAYGSGEVQIVDVLGTGRNSRRLPGGSCTLFMTGGQRGTAAYPQSRNQHHCTRAAPLILLTSPSLCSTQQPSTVARIRYVTSIPCPPTAT